MAGITRTGMAWALLFAALVCLLGYTIYMGYHRDTLLLLMVMTVRLAAGYGIGFMAAVVVGGIDLVRRKEGKIGRFLTTMICVGSVSVIGLVGFNLFQGA